MPEDLLKMLEGLGKPNSDNRYYGVLLSVQSDNKMSKYTKVYPRNGSDFKLDELYQFVGEPIEMVYIDDEHFMIINEEGKLKDLPLNMVATIISNLLPDDVIVGNALVCGKDQVL